MLFPAAVALDPLSGNAFRNLASYLLGRVSWWGRERGRQLHWTESSCGARPSFILGKVRNIRCNVMNAC